MNKATACLFSLAAAILLTGCIPLQQAARSGDTAKVQRLLDQGIDVNTGNANSGTALIWAARRHTETVEFLLKRGADINATTENGTTALIQAVKWGNAECVKVLLAHGAIIDQRNSHGQNALYFAKRKGHPEIVQLIEAASQKGTTKEVAQPSVPTTLTPPVEQATPF